MSTGGVSVHVNGGRECACQRGACVSVHVNIIDSETFLRYL